MPALMVLLLVAMQFAVFGLASHAAALAVAEGGAVARASQGGESAASRLVAQDVSAIAGGLLVRPQVSVSEGAGSQMVVGLTATVPSFLPGLHLTVHAASDGPAQLFRPGG